MRPVTRAGAVPARSDARGVVRQGCEDVEAPAGDRALASALGESGEAASVELDEAVDDRDQRPRVEVAVDEVAPSERKTLPGDGRLD